MLQNMLVMFVLCFMLLLCCQSHKLDDLNKDVHELPKSNAITANTPVLTNKDYAKKIPIDSIKGITESEAIDLCFKILGEKDEETGFKLAYRCVGAIEYKGIEYYVMYRTWLVDDNHWSYIGYAMVSARGDTIYDGDVDKDGNYFLAKKQWQK